MMIRYFLIFISVLGFSNPSNPTVIHGDATFHSPQLSHLYIHAKNKAIIHWDDFSIGANETTKFIQPSTDAAVLNRVIGCNLSEIQGRLESNGHVYLINPNGFIFGKSACIDTGSFTAATLDVHNDDFLTKNEISFLGDSSAPIVNHGTIQASGKNITLISQQIENRGDLKALNGTVSLAAGREVLLQVESDQNIYIRPHMKEYPDEIGITNTGHIEAIQANLIADGQPYLYAIKHEGKIDALGIQQRDGEIYLVAEDGRVEVTGSLYATTENSGGTVHLLGDTVVLTDPARVDVSGKDRGGTVLIGGDFKGKNPNIPNASLVYVGENVGIDASAIETGNGGKVILWGDHANWFYGSIDAKGGETFGNGGFVEVSSHGAFDPRGLVNTLAPNGNIGTYLMDPVTVTTGAGDSMVTSPPPLNPAPTSTSYVFSGSPVTIGVATLGTNLTTNHIVIDATTGAGGTGAITVADGFPITWTAAPVPTSLTLIGTSIRFDDSLTASNTGASDSFNTLVMTAPIIEIGDPTHTHSKHIEVKVTSGNIIVNASTSFSCYGGVSLPGEANLVAGVGFPGTITINAGDVNVLAGTTGGIFSGAAIETQGPLGHINLNLTGNLLLRGGTSGGSINALINPTVSGDVNVMMTGDNTSLRLEGNVGAASSAAIGQTSPGVTGNTNIHLTGANSSIFCLSGTGSSSFAVIMNQSGGNLTVECTGDFTAVGGEGTTECRAGIQATAGGTIDVACNNLTLTGGSINPNIAMISTTSGDVHVSAQGDVILSTLGATGPLAFQTRIATEGSDMTLLFGGSLTVGNGTTITNAGTGDLIIVVDNDFPTFPGIGTGSIIVEPTGTIVASNGALRIFTASQSLNDIQGTLNGLNFVPGTEFTDTAEEQWGTYYPSLLGGIPYTVFYKDGIPSDDALATIEAQSLAFTATQESLRFLHPYNQWISLSLQFQVAHDREKPIAFHDYLLKRRTFRQDTELVNIQQ